jgi:pimeloyl-ACP methyl ester carboxylesterase
MRGDIKAVMTRRNTRFYFQNEKGEKLAGILDLPEGEPLFRGVFGPCFTCLKESHGAAKICRALADLGVMMLRFDPAGYGESAGVARETSFTTRTQDMVSAVRALEAAAGPVKLLMGHSISGTAALTAARQLPGLEAVATAGSPADPQSVIEKFRRTGILRETGAGAEINVLGRAHVFDASFVDDMLAQETEEDTRRIAQRLFVFHAPHDDIVSFSNAKTIAERAGNRATLVRLDEAATHLFEKRAEDAEFIARTLAAAL